MSRLSKSQQRALAAVASGSVTHVHPFLWAVSLPWMDVKPRTLQSLAARGFIKVEANSKSYFRPVSLTDAGRRAKLEVTMAIANGVSPDDPVLARCRGNDE